MRGKFTEEFPLPWQIELLLFAAGALASAVSVFVGTVSLSFVVNTAFKDLLATVGGTGPIAIPSIGAFWPLLVVLFVILWARWYALFRRFILRWVEAL